MTAADCATPRKQIATHRKGQPAVSPGQRPWVMRMTHKSASMGRSVWAGVSWAGFAIQPLWILGFAIRNTLYLPFFRITDAHIRWCRIANPTQRHNCKSDTTPPLRKFLLFLLFGFTDFPHARQFKQVWLLSLNRKVLRDKKMSFLREISIPWNS